MNSRSVSRQQATQPGSAPGLPAPISLFFTVPCPTLEQEVRIAAWAFAPQHASEFLPNMWMLCTPGGTYRGLAYYDRQVPGYVPFAFSFARHMAMEGIGVIVIDNLGTGTSRAPGQVTGEQITCEAIADAYRHLVIQARSRLEAGTLLPGLAQVSDPFMIGVGHSMGGLFIVETQGRYHPFDVIVVLGYAPGKAANDLTVPGIEDASAVVQQAFQQMSPDGYLTLDRRVLRPFFFSEQVPAALIEADDADATVIPAGVIPFLQPGAAAQEAAHIRVPVYLSFADMDFIPATREEPAAYPSSNSITLYLQAGTGAHHCANFEPARFILWRDITSWCRAKAVQTKVPRASFSRYWHLPLDLPLYQEVESEPIPKLDVPR